MIFKGINNQFLEFKIDNYEFPEEESDYYDSNWLEIKMIVKSDLGNWETIDPALLTHEFESLIDWFDKLSKNEKVENELMDFIEPNIAFELLNNDNQVKRIRISFDLESRPKNANDEIDYFIDCDLDLIDLKRIFYNLKSELNRFPTRGLS